MSAAAINQPAAVSIVIPVFNEAEVLEELFGRLYPVVDGLTNRTEIIFIDDGSKDRSEFMLRAQLEARPELTRIVSMRTNAGQHAAIIAGFQQARGDYVITLDADLQNPPEEIPRIVAEMDKGFDYIGSIRDERKDQKWRHFSSRLMNRVRERITNIVMTDQGCMLRGYSRDIAAAVVSSNESQTFIPALAFLYAINPTEIEVRHDVRAAGESKYSLFKLIQLNFDLITSFSVMPLQLISLTGIGISFVSFLLVLYLAGRRLFIGPEVEGVFTLFGIAIFMMGLLLFAVGMVGEYIGRMYSQIRPRRRLNLATITESPESQWDENTGDVSGDNSGLNSEENDPAR